MKRLALFVLTLLFIIGAPQKLYEFLGTPLGLSSAYAEEKEYGVTRISLTLEEIKEITPDILNMTLEVTITAQKEAEAINMLGAVDKAIRALNIKYSGGSYSVYKNCWWERDRKKCSGYKGEIGYSFELSDPKEQNRVLDTIDGFKEKYGEKMNYTVSKPKWLISSKIVKTIENELKLEMIDNAQNFAKKAGEKLGKTCSISSIDYDIRRPYFWEPPIYKSMMIEKSMVEAPEPKKEEKLVNVKASVKFICR
ncbi:SIMPL domain-containing protein [Thermodesulfovibrio sp. TK110]